MEIDQADGYRLLHQLNGEHTLLCSDVSGNVVVLKRLEDDCLHRRQLHPSIKDRLVHVRELAHPRVAILRTVERWEGVVYLVWQYLEGETWDDASARSDDQLLTLFSSLARAVDALHENGIVHGSLHGQNVIVRPGFEVWLTHVSPYLYADRQVDILATVDLVRRKLSSAMSPRISPMLGQLETGEMSLREFSHVVLTTEKNPSGETPPIARRNRGHRISSLLMAATVMIAAMFLWIAVQRVESRSTVHGATTFPSLQH